MPEWSFFTNHGFILAAIAERPDSTAREIGDAAGITERAAHKIINDLDKAGYITRKKVGRKNKYRIHEKMFLHEEISDSVVSELLAMLGARRRKN